MTEAILGNRPAPEPILITERPAQGTASESLRGFRTVTEKLLQELRTRWAEMQQRTEEQAIAASRSLGRELREDAKYMRIRARYYHQSRPLPALGIVAAAAFVFGLALGLWRR